jgi:uncharacterized protein YbjT (DUF2867 family)
VKRKIIAVIGATGSQGKGLVNALVNEGAFIVRAITRNPEKYSGKAHEVVFGDLNDLQSLKDAFKNAYGVFLVTNFWEEPDEIAQAKNAIDAAKEAGIKHFVWSTLPNVESISDGEFEVPHFTNKARVDGMVRSAGFEYCTFVQPPFYFQNFLHLMAPQPKPDGSTGWTLPIDPTKKAFHMADINDLGKVITGAFLHPEKVGNGAYVSLATELNSFNDILQAFKENGEDHTFTRVPLEVFSTFFEGANEVAAMLRYFEKYTYMGPNSKPQIELAKRIATDEFVPFKEWISQNIKNRKQILEK